MNWLVLREEVKLCNKIWEMLAIFGNYWHLFHLGYVVIIFGTISCFTVNFRHLTKKLATHDPGRMHLGNRKLQALKDWKNALHRFWQVAPVAWTLQRFFTVKKLWQPGGSWRVLTVNWVIFPWQVSLLSLDKLSVFCNNEEEDR